MDLHDVVLILNIVFGLSLWWKTLKVVRINKHQRECFNRLVDFVWSHALFMDQDGKTCGDYNKKDIENRWDEYHKICQDFRKGL